jgi:quinol monooxygenase YgiN
MSEAAIILSVMIEAVAGREQELAAMLGAMIVPTRAEPGCLGYELHISTEDPAMLFFYEKFLNQQAIDAHVNSVYFQAFLRQREKSDPIKEQTVKRWSTYRI